MFSIHDVPVMCVLLSLAGSCDFYVNLLMIDGEASVKYGAPETMWIRYTARPSGTSQSGMTTC